MSASMSRTAPAPNPASARPCRTSQSAWRSEPADVPSASGHRSAAMASRERGRRASTSRAKSAWACRPVSRMGRPSAVRASRRPSRSTRSLTDGQEMTVAIVVPISGARPALPTLGVRMLPGEPHARSGPEPCPLLFQPRALRTVAEHEDVDVAGERIGGREQIGEALHRSQPPRGRDQTAPREEPESGTHLPWRPERCRDRDRVRHDGIRSAGTRPAVRCRSPT